MSGKTQRHAATPLATSKATVATVYLKETFLRFSEGEQTGMGKRQHELSFSYPKHYTSQPISLQIPN